MQRYCIGGVFGDRRIRGRGSAFDREGGLRMEGARGCAGECAGGGGERKRNGDSKPLPRRHDGTKKKPKHLAQRRRGAEKKQGRDALATTEKNKGEMMMKRFAMWAVGLVEMILTAIVVGIWMAFMFVLFVATGGARRWHLSGSLQRGEIGRASCRERVEI